MDETEYKIDKNIPIPESRMATNARKATKKLSIHSKQIAAMEVGDSFLVPEEDEISSTDVLNKYYVPANRMGMRVVIRKIPEGFRVWRAK